MSSKRGERVQRPTRSSEFELIFGTREAAKGWQDLLAVARAAMVDAYEQLTAAPLQESQRQYRLQRDYATGTLGVVTYERWQYKVTNGARLWYFVDQSPTSSCVGRVIIERAMPAHPKETDRPARG